ncbi:MAG: hypothetical protein WCJ58_06135 [bacterium]
MAKELSPPFVIANYKCDVGWELYWYIVNLLGTIQNSRKCLDFPKELIDKCNLDPYRDGGVELRSFITRNAPLYFKVVSKSDATSLFVNYVEANYNESLVPNGTTVIKNGNVWTIYRPMKFAWASLNVYIKAKIGGSYGPVASPVRVISY